MYVRQSKPSPRRRKAAAAAQVERLLRLPWTIQVRYHAEQGGYWSAHVAEIPGLLYCTEKRERLLSELEEVMRMCFEDALAHGEPIPEPAAAPV